MKIVTFFNNKGGVGKTTTVVNLASYLSMYYEKKVLLIDLDPQSNSTQLIVHEKNWLDYYGKDPIHKTIYNYFENMDEGAPTLENQGIPLLASQNNYKIDLIPGHPKLAMIDDLMSKSWNGTLGQDKGELRKLNWLNQMKPWLNDYDFVFIDVGPSLGALNRSILLNTDYFFAPMGSDIFSLLGVENIATWMKRWMELYTDALKNIQKSDSDYDFTSFSKKYSINDNVTLSSRFIGYSIQQYSKRKFADKERPVQAYEKVIKDMHSVILRYLGGFMPEGMKEEQIKLGDIPYVYSIVPLSQTSNTPIFELNYKSGVRGNQTSSVTEYKRYIQVIAENFLKNTDDTK
ncbi:DnaB domain protein helicase domain protein [Desulfitobacterium hafniense]|uniref:DnaB domain protein helicase domain protein n=1 Tax=Desulfitobacterium hafniense TaxID=49338 RepID=A0A098BAJ3_DESHA|nr:ParA family protein [Desulfitobacterium hafniense]CDX04896.1 DnaB domain protein helicase domain protein [Desulfitobacterium hafniense]